MFKKLTILTALALSALSTEHMAGGYNKVPTPDIEKLRFEQQFLLSQMKAREDFIAKHNFQLGELKAVQTQIVAGVNYKMLFESGKGDYEVIVFSQPWSQLYEVTSVRRIDETL